VRVNEVMIPLRAALARAEVRGDVFAWFTAHADEVLGRVGEGRSHGRPVAGGALLHGGRPRAGRGLLRPAGRGHRGSEGQLRGALEAIDVCVAERAAQRETVAP
jgi:hypothetical protein